MYVGIEEKRASVAGAFYVRVLMSKHGRLNTHNQRDMLKSRGLTFLGGQKPFRSTIGYIADTDTPGIVPFIFYQTSGLSFAASPNV